MTTARNKETLQETNRRGQKSQRAGSSLHMVAVKHNGRYRAVEAFCVAGQGAKR
jgi:hypothetical protein